jgi:hypothetical protein
MTWLRRYEGFSNGSPGRFLFPLPKTIGIIIFKKHPS